MINELDPQILQDAVETIRRAADLQAPRRTGDNEAVFNAIERVAGEIAMARADNGRVQEASRRLAAMFDETEESS